MLAHVDTVTLVGLDAVRVYVEVDVQPGLPVFNIVGLPDASVREARERVRSALKNSGFDFPQQRITVNLAPADLHKNGPAFDLAIACGALVASAQLEAELLRGCVVTGELSLDGRLRPVNGALALAQGAKTARGRRLVLPIDNVAEVVLVTGIEPVGVVSLAELPAALSERTQITRPCQVDSRPKFDVDLADVRGHSVAKQALEIAAAGGHNLLLYGPPGTGKTMIAQRMPTLLPPLSEDEALEVTKIYSVAEASRPHTLVSEPPFRAPHHTASRAALVGGGAPLRPGEITLAHNGVLFLDELAEFSRPTLEALRQPLEDGVVTVARARQRIRFPANFALVAASNPCPCGFAGDPTRMCKCQPTALARYRSRLSGPFMDRIDLAVPLARPTVTELSGESANERSESVRDRVSAARARQRDRLHSTPVATNAKMGTGLAKKHCALPTDADQLLQAAERRLALGGRGYVRILRVARTIADLANRERVVADDVALALAFRPSAAPAQGLD